MKMPDSRDRVLERLLRERPDTGRSPVRGVCLDADTLAAWMDDELGHEERAAAETHVAECSRCQMLLAAMAKTAPAIPESRAWWRRRPLAWAAPLAAAAMALVIWVATPGQHQRAEPVTSVADSRTTTAPPAPAAAPSPAAPPASSVDTSLRDELKAVPQKQAATAKKEAREQEQDAGASAGRLRAESNQRFEEEQRAARGQRADALQQNKLDAARQKPSGNEVAGAAPVSPPTASPPAAAAEAAPMAKAMVARPAPVMEIVSSNPGSRWRIVAGRSVQRSMDGGSTWQDQELGVSVALTAGSSPMPSVCWLVGSGATVLVTVDGRTWRRVAFPEAVELIAVRATDAQSATVTTADGRTFSTVDGGATWGRTGV